MKKIKTAAIGLGRLGYQHAENIAFRIPEMSLQAVCSIDETELSNAQAKLGVPETYLDYAQMLKQTDLDAVVLTSPSHLHCDQIAQALKSGLHVFCEKPLGTTLEDCQRAAEVVNAHPNQVFMLGFMRRYDPSYVYAKQKIDEGFIGKPILFRGYSVDPESAIEGAIKFAAHSAGQFLDMAVHDIDLARWLLNAEPKNVFAMGGCYAHPEFGQYGDGDNVSALMQFDNQAMAFFFAGRTAPHGYNVETEIVGTKATLRIGAVPQKNLVEILDHSGVRQECSQNFIERFDEAYLNEVREFARCILSEKQPEVSVEDGLEATRIAIAATKSFQEGQLMEM